MKVKTAFGAVVVLVGAATVTTILNDPDVMKGFINSPLGAQRNYDDGNEKVVIRMTWGDGQFAYMHITVNGEDYYAKKRDAFVDDGGHAPQWHLKPSKGDKIEASVIPSMVNTGSSCSITDPKHPEMAKPPAITAAYTGKSSCEYTVLG